MCYKMTIQIISAKNFHKGDVVKHGKVHHGRKEQGHMEISQALTTGVSNKKKFSNEEKEEIRKASARLVASGEVSASFFEKTETREYLAFLCRKLGKPSFASEFVVKRHGVWKEFENQSKMVQNFILQHADKLVESGKIALQVDHWTCNRGTLEANNDYFGVIITLRDTGGDLIPLVIGFEPAVKRTFEDENGQKIVQNAKSFEVVKFQLEKTLRKFGLLEKFQKKLIPITTDSALIGAFNDNHLAISCNAHNMSNIMQRLIKTEAHTYVRVVKYSEEIKKITQLINGASHVAARVDQTCSKCANLQKPDPKCQKCALCYKSLNLYIGSKGELSAKEKEHIAGIKFKNFETMENGEKAKILESIRHRKGVPKICPIRFDTYFKSVGAVLQSQFLIEELTSSISADSGLIEERVDFNLCRALYDVLRPVVEKLKLFENNSANMSDYITASIDILTVCLEKDVITNRT